jgi:5-methylcytosine-specific restriction protein B
MYCPVERRSIQQNLERILSRYTSARSSEPIGKEHEVWGIFEELHEEFSELQAVKSEPTLKVSWSAGQGVWAKVPWIAFLDSRETTTTKRGSTASSSSDRMPAGSISPSITGSPSLTTRLGAHEGRKFLHENANEIQKRAAELSSNGFRLDDEIDLRADPGLGAEYATSTIAYKLYEKGQVPADKEIEADLAVLLSAYDDYLYYGRERVEHLDISGEPRILRHSRSDTSPERTKVARLAI